MNGTIATELGGAEWRVALVGDGFVAEHRVGGVPVLPGVAYLDFAVRAARRELGAPGVALDDVVVVAPLVLHPGEEATVRVALARGRGGRVWFRILSALPGRRDVEHASGSFRLLEPGAEPPRPDLASVTRRCPTLLRGEVFYHPRHRPQAIEYGPYFRSVAWARTNPGEVLASVALPGPARRDADHVLHPSLLDGALQALAAVLEAEARASLYVPFAFGCVRVFDDPPARALVWGRRKDDAAASGTDLLRGDVRLCDEEGRVRVALDDVVLKRVPPGRAMTDSGAAERNEERRRA